MHDLDPTSHHIPMVALSEEHYIPFPNYLDNKSYQRVAEDGMHIHNHDFNEIAKPVCSDLSPFCFVFFFFFEREFLCLHFFKCFLFAPAFAVVTATWNMARQHREPYLRLDDVEQLQRYAQSAVSKHNALDDALGKARAKSKYWEWEAKKGIERAMGAEKERDEAKEEA